MDWKNIQLLVETLHMNIVSWNCNMAFRRKADFILKFEPDILVVPECESLQKLTFGMFSSVPTDQLWFGVNPNKGLGIFSFGNYRFKLLDVYNPDFKYVIPIEVSGGTFDFNLYAIWANNIADKDGRYITQVWKAVNYYNSLLTYKSTILIGDFNSNTIWDKPRRTGNHSTVVDFLKDKGILSTYHVYFNQEQGNESHPTLFMYRNEQKAYHIDYCFASKDLIEKLNSVKIGEYELWKKYSDHAPIIVKFNLFNVKYKDVGIG